MGSSTVIILLAFFCMVTAIFDTSYRTYTKQDLVDGLFNRDQRYKDERTVNRGYPEDCNTTLAPPDDLSGDFGDLLYRWRQPGDELLLRETFLNDKESYKEQIVFWSGNFNRTYITSVRSLNFGRERGWTRSIHVYNKTSVDVDINVIIPANTTVRLFFEVYGYRNQTNNGTLYELN